MGEQAVNDADKKKLQTALMTITTLDGKLEDLLRKGPGAAKYWAAYVKTNKGLTDAQKKRVTGEYVPGMGKLLKDAKVVLKDLNTLYKEGSNPKVLASYPTGKEFRAKLAEKRLASMRAFELFSSKYIFALTTFYGKNDTDYLGMEQAAVRPAIESIKAAASYYNEIRADLAKL
jgi:hypothetical protein